MRLDLAPNSQEPRAETRWVNPRTSADLVEIVVAFEEEPLRLSLIAQTARKPILDCVDDHGRPQPPFGNYFRSNILVTTRRGGGFHHFPLSLHLRSDFAKTKQHLLGKCISLAN